MVETNVFSEVMQTIISPQYMAILAFLIYSFGVRRSQIRMDEEDTYALQKNLYLGFEYFRDSLLLPFLFGLSVPFVLPLRDIEFPLF